MVDSRRVLITKTTTYLMSQKDKQEIAELLAKIITILNTESKSSEFVGPHPTHPPRVIEDDEQGA